MPESKTNTIAKNTFYLFIRMVLVLLVGLYTSRVILHALGETDFGIYNLVGGIVVFLNFFVRALKNATNRFITFELGKKDENKLSNVYSMSINIHFLLALIILVVTEIAGVWFLNNKLVIPPDRLSAANWVFHFSLLTFCASIILVPFESNIIAHERMSFYAFVSVVEVTLKLLIAIAIAHYQFDKLIFYAFLMFALSGVMLISNVLYCKICFHDTKYKKRWYSNLLKELTSFSGWSLLVSSVDVLTVQSISVFFNRFVGLAANAALGVTNQVVGHLKSFVFTFTQAFNPQMYKSYAAGEDSYFMQMIYSSSKICYLLLLFISLPVIANVDFVLTLWLGEYPSMAPIFIKTIIIYNLIDALQNPLLVAVHATGRIKVHQIIISTIMLVGIPVMYFALRMGAEPQWVIIIWAIDNLLCAIARTIYSKKLLNLSLRKYFFEVVLKLVSITLIAVPITFFIVEKVDGEITGFILSSIIACALVGGLGYLFVLDKREKRIVVQLPFVGKIFGLLNIKNNTKE